MVFEPPLAIQLHPQYCPCARHHKWAPNVTIASVEYNWPQIQWAPGLNTPGQCRDAYLTFHEEHRAHKYILYVFELLCFVLFLQSGAHARILQSMSIATTHRGWNLSCC